MFAQDLGLIVTFSDAFAFDEKKAVFWTILMLPFSAVPSVSRFSATFRCLIFLSPMSIEMLFSSISGVPRMAEQLFSTIKNKQFFNVISPILQFFKMHPKVLIDPPLNDSNPIFDGMMFFWSFSLIN